MLLKWRKKSTIGGCVSNRNKQKSGCSSLLGLHSVSFFYLFVFFQRQACLPLKFLHLVSVISIQELNWTEKELNMPVTISVDSVSRTYSYFSRVYSHNMLFKPSVFFDEQPFSDSWLKWGGAKKKKKSLFQRQNKLKGCSKANKEGLVLNCD